MLTLNQHQFNMPARMRAWVWSLAVLLFALCIYRHYFFPWSCLTGGDVLGVHAPFLVGLKNSIQAGQPFPFWFKELCCGVPAIPDISTNLLHPIYQLLRWFEVSTVVKFQILLNLLLMFWGNVHWLRSNGIEEKTSHFWAFASVAFFPIQGLLSFGHLGIFSSVVLLPWALFLIVDFTPNWRRCFQLSIVLGLAWLTGHPQLTLMLHEVVFLTLLFRLKSWSECKQIFYFILAALLGLCLALPQLLPTAIHIFQSGRVASLNDAEFLNSGSLGILQILRWFHPGMFGDESSYWGQHTYWFGVLFSGPLLFHIFMRGLRELPRWALILLVLCFLLALGHYTPLYSLRQMLVPGAKLFRYSSRFIYMAGPFILLALCYGSRQFLNGNFSKKILSCALIFSLLVLSLLAIPNEFLTDFIPQQVLERRQNSLHFSWFALLICLQLLGTFLLKSPREKLKKWALYVIVILQIGLWSQQHFSNVKMAHLPSKLLPPVQGRVLTLTDQHPNLGLLQGFESLTGYVGMTPKAYRNFLDTQVEQNFQKRNRLQISGFSSTTLDYLQVVAKFSTQGLSERATAGKLYAFADSLQPLPLRPDSPFSESIRVEQLQIGEAFKQQFGEAFSPEKGFQNPADQSENTVQCLSRESEKVVLKTHNARAGILVGLENTHPFWSAKLDGEPLQIVPWLGTFRSIFVPKGDHLVEFSIDRRLFYGSLIFSLATLCLAFGGIWIRKTHE